MLCIERLGPSARGQGGQGGRHSRATTARGPCRVTCLHKQLSTQVRDGPSRPEDATLDCLTMLRKADVTIIRPWMEAGKVDDCSQKLIAVGGYEVLECSPFVACTQVMDAAARRVLPGHLLRRCQVLSSFTMGPRCQQRVSITACSGEQSVFVWVMSQQQQQQQQEGEREGEGAGAWLVESIQRDPLQDDQTDSLPSRPHPRASPETVIKAQLAALQRGDVAAAARYNLWGRSTSGGWEVNQDGFRTLLRQAPYHQLLTHVSSHLGAAALPTPHHFVQEVEIAMQPISHARTQASCRMVWDMRLQGNGCWATCGIRPAAS